MSDDSHDPHDSSRDFLCDLLTCWWFSVPLLQLAEPQGLRLTVFVTYRHLVYLVLFIYVEKIELGHSRAAFT